MDMWVRVRRGLLLLGLLAVVSLAGFVPSRAIAAVKHESAASSIVVEGNRRVDADTIRSYFKAGPDGRLDAAAINAGIKALYASGLFEDIHVAPEGGRLVVSVVEASVIDRISFEGNYRIKDEQLLQEIESKPRGALSRPKVQQDTQRIIELYHTMGRFNVTVVPQIIERPNNRVDLIFKIHEGEKTGVAQIIFVGNHVFSDWRLKDVIKTTVSHWFLSFLQTTDIYDPDRIEADRDLLRRFYLKHGYADVQIVAATGEYDPSKKGFVVTFTIEEGPQYRFGKINIQSTVHAVDANSLRSDLLTYQGQIYNGDAVEKTVEALTIAMARRGYPFGTVRPRGDRNAATRTIGVTYTIDEGTRAYIERINIRGNTRTRDYVIRRELDINEGDPYNRALLDRAERRLKNLNFFKSVKITTEPGSAPDRVIVDIDVVEQSTGNFSVMGGYSTAEGWMVQASVSERNLLGTGRYGSVSATYGEYVRAGQLDFVEPYFLGERLSAGISLFAKETLANSYFSYGTTSIGTTLKLGLPLTEALSLQLRYSIYTQKIDLPYDLNDCNNRSSNPDFWTPAYQKFETGSVSSNCISTYGQASLPIRVELADGATLTSMLGYGLTYNTLDNNKNPTGGVNLNVGQDFAGIGGDVSYMRSIADFHAYYQPISDLITVLHLQAGDILGLGGSTVRMLDDFKMGPNLVRGFQPAGIGPRDLSNYDYGYGTGDALGGTMYWGASLELQYPLYFMPKGSGFRGAVFIDSGSVWDYRGETESTVTGEYNGFNGCQCGLQYADSAAVRLSAGASLIWDSPFGPLRFDFAYPILKQWYDRTQFFQFGGGTSF